MDEGEDAESVIEMPRRAGSRARGQGVPFGFAQGRLRLWLCLAIAKHNLRSG